MKPAIKYLVSLWILSVVTVLLVVVSGRPINHNHDQNLCDRPDCMCEQFDGNLTCDCSKGNNKDINIESSGVNSLSLASSSIRIVNCDRVTIGENSVKYLKKLHTIELINIDRLNVQASGFKYGEGVWTKESSTLPNLKLTIRDSKLESLGSAAISGRTESVLFDNVDVVVMDSFAFSSLENSQSITFENCTFRQLNSFIMRKFSTENIILNKCLFTEDITGRLFSEVLVRQSVRFSSCALRGVFEDAFVLQGLRTFLIFDTRIVKLSGSAIKLIVDGPVVIENSRIDEIGSNAFKQLSVPSNTLRTKGKQDFIMKNVSIGLYYRRAIVIKESDFNVRINSVYLDRVCQCDTIKEWSDDLIYYGNDTVKAAAAAAANRLRDGGPGIHYSPPTVSYDDQIYCRQREKSSLSDDDDYMSIRQFDRDNCKRRNGDDNASLFFNPIFLSFAGLTVSVILMWQIYLFRTVCHRFVMIFYQIIINFCLRCFRCCFRRRRRRRRRLGNVEDDDSKNGDMEMVERSGNMIYHEIEAPEGVAVKLSGDGIHYDLIANPNVIRDVVAVTSSSSCSLSPSPTVGGRQRSIMMERRRKQQQMTMIQCDLEDGSGPSECHILNETAIDRFAIKSTIRSPTVGGQQRPIIIERRRKQQQMMTAQCDSEDGSGSSECHTLNRTSIDRFGIKPTIPSPTGGGDQKRPIMMECCRKQQQMTMTQCDSEDRSGQLECHILNQTAIDRFGIESTIPSQTTGGQQRPIMMERRQKRQQMTMNQCDPEDGSVQPECHILNRTAIDRFGIESTIPSQTIGGQQRPIIMERRRKQQQITMTQCDSEDGSGSSECHILNQTAINHFGIKSTILSPTTSGQQRLIMMEHPRKQQPMMMTQCDSEEGSGTSECHILNETAIDRFRIKSTIPSPTVGGQQRPIIMERRRKQQQMTMTQCDSEDGSVPSECHILNQTSIDRFGIKPTIPSPTGGGDQKRPIMMERRQKRQQMTMNQCDPEDGSVKPECHILNRTAIDRFRIESTIPSQTIGGQQRPIIMERRRKQQPMMMTQCDSEDGSGSSECHILNQTAIDHFGIKSTIPLPTGGGDQKRPIMMERHRKQQQMTMTQCDLEDGSGQLECHILNQTAIDRFGIESTIPSQTIGGQQRPIIMERRRKQQPMMMTQCDSEDGSGSSECHILNRTAIDRFGIESTIPSQTIGGQQRPIIMERRRKQQPMMMTQCDSEDGSGPSECHILNETAIDRFRIKSTIPSPTIGGQQRPIMIERRRKQQPMTMTQCDSEDGSGPSECHILNETAIDRFGIESTIPSQTIGGQQRPIIMERRRKQQPMVMTQCDSEDGSGPSECHILNETAIDRFRIKSTIPSPTIGGQQRPIMMKRRRKQQQMTMTQCDPEDRSGQNPECHILNRTTVDRFGIKSTIV